MDQRSLVSLEIGQQLADAVFQAPDASHAAYGCTPRPAAERRELAPASRPTPMPKPPLRTLQSADRLGGQVCVGHAKAASGLQCVFEAHRGGPPIQHDCGIRQRLALQAPQSRSVSLRPIVVGTNPAGLHAPAVMLPEDDEKTSQTAEDRLREMLTPPRGLPLHLN
jgi:hypothetical protein